MLALTVAFGTTSAEIGVLFSGWDYHGLYYITLRRPANHKIQ